MKSAYRRILSVFLAIVMATGIFTVSFAQEKTVDSVQVNSIQQATELLKDTSYPTIVIHGIGQANTFEVDENGERIIDQSGNPVTGWPVYLNATTLVIKLIAPLLFSLCLQRDLGLSDMVYKAAYEQMYHMGYNDDGTRIGKFVVEGYDNKSVAECTQEEKDRIYGNIPLQQYAAAAGEENLYYFAYDSFGDTYTIVDELEAIIEKAKRETGKDKVNLVPVSLGGAISVAYIGEHPQGEDINKVVLIVPAADGSEIVGKIMLGELDYSDEGLYRNMFTKLVGTDNYTGWLINIALRVLPKSVIKDVLRSLAAGLTDSMLARVPTMWGLVPASMFDRLAEKYLTPGTVFADKIYKFHEAQLNYIDNIKNYEKNGIQVYNICGYGLELYSLIDSDCNSDKIIHSASTSLGATFSKVNETLGENYTQKYLTEYNLISPDRQVDASTCAFPLRTWFFGGQDHEALGHNDVVISLATKLLIYKNVNVFSMPEYPQFNGHRNSEDLEDYLKFAKGVDTSMLNAEQKALLASAIKAGEDNLAKTIIVEGENERVTQQLKDVLVELGFKEKEDKTVDNILLFVCRTASELLYVFYGPRGFSDCICA